MKIKKISCTCDLTEREPISSVWRSEMIKNKNDELIKAKKRFEKELEQAELMIKFYEEKKDFYYKNKLEELNDTGVINSKYEPL